MTNDEFHVEPDPRMALFIGGVDEAGPTRPMGPGRLREIATAWKVTCATPSGVTGLLKTSRELFIHSHVVYEFLTLGVLLSLQAVETSLKVRLAVARLSFEKLIDRGAAGGLFDIDVQERRHAGRELRNLFSHPEQETVWSYGMTAPLIARSHEVVAHLFPGATETSAAQVWGLPRVWLSVNQTGGRPPGRNPRLHSRRRGGHQAGRRGRRP